jgi:Ni/Fe-hydrogenase subunit HybB-like protein
MSSQAHAHAPIGGEFWTRPFRTLVAIAAIGGAVALWRYVFGLGAVANINDGYPWGIWIAFDVVTGTALGCGGFAVALLVYILNKGRYHPLVRPAILTSLLGYGLAVLAVAIDLGRPWELWKIPLFFCRWTGSPQLEVALCVTAYVGVLAIELSPAFLEKWKESPDSGLRRFAKKGLAVLNKSMLFFIALGILLPTMHQSSLGTMMLLPGQKLHPLWLTPWLPFLFLVNCMIMGYGVAVLESHASASAFGAGGDGDVARCRMRCGSRLSSGFRAWTSRPAPERSVPARPRRPAGAGPARGRARPGRRTRRRPAGRPRRPLLVGGAVYRFNVYLVAFRPGEHWSYFPAVPELLITFGIVALEILLYVAAVKTFPILAGEPEPARA